MKGICDKREKKSELFSFRLQVVAFMNSRVGQYLDDHPFVALSLLMFIAVSAIPVAFFLVFVVTTAIMACVGVIVMEGTVCIHVCAYLFPLKACYLFLFSSSLWKSESKQLRISVCSPQVSAVVKQLIQE